MSQQVRFAPGASLDVVYVAGTGARPPAPIVTVQRADGSEVPIAPGHHPAWADASSVVYCPPNDGVVQDAHGLGHGITVGAFQPPLPAGNTLTASAGKVAVHRTDPRRVLTSWGWTLGAETDPALSADGHWLATLEPDSPHPGVSTVNVWDATDEDEDQPRRVYIGAPLRPRFSHTGTSLAWEDAGQLFGIADVANPQSPVQRLSRPEDRLSHPVPLWVPERGELFVLYVQDHGETGVLHLAEWGSCVAQAPVGYVLVPSSGSGFDHDVRSATERYAEVAMLTPDGTLRRVSADYYAAHAPLPLPPAPPVIEPPPVDPERWSFVPDGTLVTDAFTAMFGAAPSTSPDGKRICLHKNVNEQEWRELDPIDVGVFHLFDRSRYPGDVGWYLVGTPGPLWAMDRFKSGQSFRFDGEIVEMSNGHRNRWTHANTLYGLKQGGVCVQFDPRFPHQDYGPEKCYERHFNRLDGGVRWELWYSPEAARSLPWGDRSLDVLKQAVEAQAAPGQPTPAYIECPRLSVSDDPWAKPVTPPPTGDDMTHDDIHRYIGALDDPLVFGALERFHNEVLPRDRAEHALIESEAGPEMWTGDMVTGGAMGYFVRAYISEYLIAMDKGRTAAQASGDGYDKAIAAYRAVVNPPTTPPVQPPSALVPLNIDGTTFRRPDGTIWKYRMVTAFNAFQRFLAGDDLTAYANWTRSVGGNGWRIFYTWKGTNFNPRHYGWQHFQEGLIDFRAWMDAQGLYSHNTVFCDQTDGSPVLLSRGEQAELLGIVRGVMQGRHIEEMNEYWQNGGPLQSPADAFRGTFGARSSWQDGGVPTDAGSLLDWTGEHTPRDAEWPRKAKNMLETSVQGIGSFPATTRPAVGSEPIGIHEVDIPGSRTANASDVADYFAVAELFSAGVCLHGDGSTLQRCIVPGPVAQQCAEWAHAARICIPADAQLGSYTRGGLDDCPLEHRDDVALRTFAMIQGNRATCVVVRPVAGWQPIARNGWRIDSVEGPNGHIVKVSR